MQLPVLRKRSRGEIVEQWQNFLRGKDIYKEEVDGIFGSVTERATKVFQKSVGLKDDGIVGRNTYREAIDQGFDVVEEVDDFPPLPDFSSPTRDKAESLFGRFDFVAAPTSSNREAIKILGSWQKNNITSVKVPGLKGIDVFGKKSGGTMRFHKEAKDQLVGLWSAWQNQGLNKLILSYGGSFVPRFVRGSRSRLSNHAWGSAFDINMKWNGLGVTPPARGKKGSVRRLVPIANEYGFFWGGHYGNRKDGMHFEVAKLLSKEELSRLAKKYSVT